MRLLNAIYQHPSLDDLRGNPAKLLATIDGFANNEDFLISVGTDKAEILRNLIRDDPPGVLVEFGGYLGYSAVLFADEIRRALPTGAAFRVWSLEFDPLFASIAMNLIDLAGLSDHVKVVTGPAVASLRRLVSEGALDHIDVLFLDHVESLYEPDLRAVQSLGLLRPSAQVWADNVVRPGAPDYRAYVRAHPSLQSKGVKALIMPGNFEVFAHR